MEVSTEGSRHLCLDCVSSIVVDTNDAQPLYTEVGTVLCLAQAHGFWVVNVRKEGAANTGPCCSETSGAVVKVTKNNRC